ncbi:stealth family protein [Stenoxybacter acetivorans]|uniref:stealth family protein n=1 Tax=Stenoxybacter acetivorans TaxID=422441 RepID=UPI0005691D97|nr:stealth family protein [Stenoxybacter acetivorans]
MEIDFVLPWVDDTDPEWLAEKQRYLPKQTADADAAGITRYQDLGTLRYVLRGIAKNCLWYRHIVLITAGHLPPWLNINHPKIKIITHRQLFLNTAHLPTFNSSAIEMNLVNLPDDVSEHFVYLNDDTMCLRPISPERFFQHGLPVDFIHHGWLKRNRLFTLLRGSSTWVASLNNAVELINQHHTIGTLKQEHLFAKSYPLTAKISNALLYFFYKRYFWFAHWHLPQAHTKTTLQQVYQHCGKAMCISSANRFRADNDLTAYLYRYWHLASGQFIPQWHNDGFVRNIATLTQLQKAADYLQQHPKIHFACLNDAFKKTDLTALTEFKTALQHVLEKWLPEKAPFEY